MYDSILNKLFPKEGWRSLHVQQTESAQQPGEAQQSKDAQQSENAQQPGNAQQPENAQQPGDAQQSENAQQPEDAQQPRDKKTGKFFSPYGHGKFLKIDQKWHDAVKAGNQNMRKFGIQWRL